MLIALDVQYLNKGVFLNGFESNVAGKVHCSYSGSMIKPPKWKVRGEGWQLSDSTLSADSVPIKYCRCTKGGKPHPAL